MRTPKLAVAAAAVLFALAGCGQASDSGTGSPAAATTTAPADPAAQIAAAGKKVDESSFKFSFETVGMKAEGVRHQPSQSMQMAMTGVSEGQEIKIEVVAIAQDVWTKMDLGIDPGDDPAMQGLAEGLGKWNKSTADEEDMPFAGAGAQTMGSGMTKGLADLKETAPGTFTGTVDITVNSDLDLTEDEATLKALGAKAKALPITFTLDSEGRFSSIVVEIPATGSVKAQKGTVKFFEYGDVPQPKAPPADQVA
ncbi:hypothetical protein Ais01nite_27040 [Asanoa ishikariensis]|uniref:Lipoprotein LprG n=1 Tax=Asanoa ishikariensis TaxID=137265 RepID=A0A1H3QV80_9ACTN|nr:hypothetical protein [Asanoa ishikariensis]GIF64669.1 hypothetical protein Ais01nite_27040 [Asanoa ishikariensis]SDZ17286.1 hypothetical protein SAMN05421684_3217 [Asanoa ishikariensis]